jgi:hypothetical protein
MNVKDLNNVVLLDALKELTEELVRRKLFPFPKYESPEEWERKHGRPLPNEAIVWVSSKHSPEWDYCEYQTTKCMTGAVVFVANGNPRPGSKEY